MNAAAFRKLIMLAAASATKPDANGEERTPAMQAMVFIGALEGQLICLGELELAACINPVARPVGIYAAAPVGV